MLDPNKGRIIHAAEIEATYMLDRHLLLISLLFLCHDQRGVVSKRSKEAALAFYVPTLERTVTGAIGRLPRN
jgi:hypothetical protein